MQPISKHFARNLQIRITNTGDATSTSDGGALTVLGGASISKNVNVGENVNVSGGITVGNINVTGQFYQNGGVYQGSQWTGSAGSAISYTSANVNVGSGTITTANILGLTVGNANITGLTGNNANITTITTGNAVMTNITTASINVTGSIVQNGLIMTSSQWAGSVGSNLSYTGGNVGIGTSTPTSTLTVVGPFSDTTSYTQSSFIQYTNILNGAGNETMYLSYSSVDGSTYVGGLYSSTQLNIFATDGTTVVATLGNLGSNAGIIAKYSSTGSLLWTSRLDGVGSDQINSASSSPDGGVYVGGQYTSTHLNVYAIDGTTIVATLGNFNSSIASILAKYSSVGSLLWTIRTDGANGEIIQSTCSSPDGGVYVGGLYSSTLLSMYATDGTTVVSTLGNLNNGNVGIVAKYDSTGSLLWRNILNGLGNDQLNAVSSSPDGGVYVGGQYGSTQLSLYSTDGTTVVATLGNFNTSNAGIVAKYGSTGSLLWTSRLDGTGSDQVNSVSASPDGGVYVGGFHGSTQVNIYATDGTVVATLGNINTNSVGIVAKYGSTGSLMWTSRLDGTGSDIIACISSNTDGSVLAGVQYVSTQLNVYGTNGTTVVATFGNLSGSSAAVAVLKYNSSGNFMMGNRIDSVNQDSALSIEGIPNGFLFSGTYAGTRVNFYDMTGSVIATYGNVNTNTAAFVTKFSDQTAATIVSSLNFTTSGSLILANNTNSTSITPSGITTGNINVTGTILQNGSPITGSQWSGTTGSNLFYTGGNVGIGTTNPTSALTVVGPFSNVTNYTKATLSTTQFDFQYANTVDGPGIDNINAVSSTLDGGVFVGGGSSSTTSLFATDGTSILSTMNCIGGNVGYITRYTSTGNLLWTSLFDGPGTDTILSVDSSNVDNGVFFCGNSNSQGTFYATNGTTILSTLGNLATSLSVAVIGKYNSSGNLLWTSRLDGFSDEFINTISTASDSGVFFGGNFSSSILNIYATNGALVRTIGNQFNGFDVGFIGKYSSTGTLLWTSHLDGRVTEKVVSVCGSNVDGGVFFGAQSSSTQLTIYATNGTILQTYGSTVNGNFDSIVGKYGSSGSLLWTSRIDGPGTKNYNCVSFSPVDNGVYVGGHINNTQGTIYATNGTSVQATIGPISSGGGNTQFVSKYTSLGTLLWTSRLERAGNGLINSVSGTTDGGVFVGGYYTGTQVTIYATNGSSILYTLGNIGSSGSAVGLVARYNSVGNLLWAASIDGIGGESVNSINASPDGFYTGGIFTSTSVRFFDGNGQVVTTYPRLATSGNNTGFIAKYSQSTLAQPVANLSNTVANNGGSLSIAGGLVVDGGINVIGTLSVSGTKNFQIPHPIPEKREQGMVLRHSALETPTRGDNVYRYRVVTSNNKISITLPDYFGYLNEDIQVFCQAERHFGQAYGVHDVSKNTVEIFSNVDGEYSVLVIGTRKDTDALLFDTLGIEFKQ